ncbi:MAG: hypothetical protein RSA10_03600 [Bacilli bacterium]
MKKENKKKKIHIRINYKKILLWFTLFAMLGGTLISIFIPFLG